MTRGREREESSRRSPPEIGEWETEQEGERWKDKGKSKSNRRVMEGGGGRGGKRRQEGREVDFGSGDRGRV